ncbi:hypothetical protein V2P24_01455 [Mycoplasma putrefaciens]|uniref:hypothetical protein n=1 Tax=Mycoplasma putrefaciens TaxID=2123 RepID=UPI003DA2D46E
MKKFFNYILILILFISSLFLIKPARYQTFDNQNLKLIRNFHSDMPHSDGLMWGGSALRYFLYRNSTAFSTDKTEYEKFVDSILKFSLVKGIVFNPRIDHITIQRLKEAAKEKFKYDFISSFLVTSAYGSTSDQEFFAESFNKYISSNENQKNVVWYLLDHFFTKTFVELKNSPKINAELDTKDEWQEVKKIIENDSSKIKDLEYKLKPETTWTPSNDLDFEYSPASQNNYGFLNPWYAQESISAIGSNIYTNNLFKKFNYSNFVTRQPKMKEKFQQYMRYTRHKPKKPVLEKQNLYKDINHLDSVWKEKSRFNLGSASAIEIKKNLDFVSSFFEHRIANFKKDLYDNTVKLFNILELMTQNRLDRIFINLILTSDNEIVDGNGKSLGKGVNGVTFTSIDLKNRSTTFSYVVIRISSFIPKINQDQYNKSWFSSNNKFQTLNHEFGHVVDGFLSKSKELIDQPFNSSFYASHQQKDLYKGSHPSSEVLVWKNTIKRILYIVAAAVIIIIFTIIIFKSRSKKQNSQD